MPIDIEPMTDGHVDAVDEIWQAAFQPIRDSAAPGAPRTDEQLARDRDRFLYPLMTDPKGSFVAANGRTVIGFCQSVLRGHRFVLSRLGVMPAAQDQGVGRALLGAALSYSSPSSEQYVFSSRDPRAFHSYVREGFALHPTVHLTGRPRSNEASATIRRGSISDLAIANEIDESTREIHREHDLRFWLDSGAILVIDDEGGYAIVTESRLTTLAATSARVARRLLSSLLGGFDGLAPVEVGWVIAEQQWAIECASECRASIRNSGALMARNPGDLGGLYLPNPLLG